MKAVRSKRSSVPSEKSVSTEGDVINYFEHYVMTAFEKFTCPVSVVVETGIRHEPVPQKSTKSPKMDRRKINKHLTQSVSITGLESLESKTQTPRKSTVSFEPYEEGTLVIKAIYNFMKNVVEVNITKYRYDCIPRVAMQILGHVISYFSTITKITIKQCRIDGYIIYEINEMLQFANLVDVCLDGSIVKEGNYNILLEKPKLCNLSLCRCNLTDIMCENIFLNLCMGKPAETTLQILNLSSNFITDEEAKYIGEALKTNRNLRYLNLSDNQLTDIGADHIFNSVTIFQLTDQDILEQRGFYINYLQAKRRILDECLSHVSDADSKKLTNKSKSPLLKPKITPKINDPEILTKEALGDYKHPYGPNNVTRNGDRLFCKGNMTLCYLNLAYNSFSYISLLKIKQVLLQQQSYMTSTQSGLLILILEGNYLPAQCEELSSINNLLVKKRNLFSSASSERKKSVASERRRTLK